MHCEEDVAVTLSHEGYVKVQSLDNYRLQRRGGRGKAATKMKEEDYLIFSFGRFSFTIGALSFHRHRCTQA